jgi:hypothetical protein
MQKIYVEMVDRRISRTYIDWFYNWEGVCLLRGTKCAFKYNSGEI